MQFPIKVYGYFDDDGYVPGKFCEKYTDFYGKFKFKKKSEMKKTMVDGKFGKKIENGK